METWLGIVLALAGGYTLRWVFSPVRLVHTDPLDVPYASCGHCATLVSAYCKKCRAEQQAVAVEEWR